MEKSEISKLQKASRRTALLSLFGVLIIIMSLIYSYYQINKLEKVLTEKQQQIDIRKDELEQLTRKVSSLSSTQESLLDFLAKVTDEESISILNSSVDWEIIKTDIVKLPAGKRKGAILTAILMAWKEIPFAMGQESISSGFDSPRFLRYVLSTVGIIIEDVPRQPLSVTLMNTFEEVEEPMPGDLVFYRGDVGNFGFILASIGDEQRPHVGIGTLQRIHPLQVVSLDYINTEHYPLIGYYRVKYTDE